MLSRGLYCLAVGVLSWLGPALSPLMSADESRETAAVQFPGTASDWNGFDRYDFEVDGRPVLVVCPRQAAPGRPWVWHGEFFGHRPAPDIALLKRGFHIAYMSVPDMLGSPKAVKHWNAFYSELTGRYRLAPKAALVGLSRGGLYCYNWAAANPLCVSCIYGDAPVCDFKSWPRGLGKGKGSPRDWQLVLECWGFASDEEAVAYRGNPVDQLASLAAAGVPLLHVYGDADEVVPWDENTGVVATRYRELGGDITLIAKPGVGHHPHGLVDSAPIVEFIVRHSLKSSSDEHIGPVRLRVLSYNIHHAEGIDGVLDVERIARVILESKADLVSLQEVDQRAGRTSRVDQPQELARLTGMYVAFGGNIDLQGGRYGNAVLSRYEIIRSKNHLLPCFDQGEQRGVLLTQVRIPGIPKLILLATHLDHRRDPQERNASAVAINDLIRTQGDHPAPLAGDMNDVADSTAMQTLAAEWSVTNSDGLPTIPVGKPTRQIDFILFRPSSDWKVLRTTVLDEAVASDHRAILSELEWRLE